MLRIAAELADDCPGNACDLDGDGRITLVDGVLTLRQAAGLHDVDVCRVGTIAGRLLIPPAAGVPVEQEPNDGPATATVVGRIAPGEEREVVGAIAGDDPFDGWAFVAAGRLTLDIALTFPADPRIDLDVLTDDRNGGSATCESVVRGSERCRVTLGSREAQAFDVVVVPASGSLPATYTLAVRASASSLSRGVVTGPGSGPPIEIEPAVYRGEAAPIAVGEILMQPLPADDGERTADDVGQRARAIVAAADRSGELRVERVAPDGTTLLALPQVRATARATADDTASARSAKQARAAARARTRALAATLAADPAVAFAEPNQLAHAARVPRDPLYPLQWHLDALGLPRAWDVTRGRANVVVAVVDTGIRSDHPDLAGRLVPGFDFISNPERANDGDGIDPDPFDPGDRPSAPDGGSFHGTHVAGTIAAATDNALGVAGVTWRTAVMPLRVLGVGGGTLFDVAQAIRFAAGLPNASGEIPPVPARIINLSLTTSADDPVLRSAVDAANDAGALVIAAAGNTGSDGFLSPAAYANVVSVAATDRLGEPARYSSFGAAVDVAAPGGDTHRDRDADEQPDGILSTLLPGTEDYGLMQGTSMASAHASGVAALLLGVPGGATATRLREVLLATADDRGAPGRDDHYGAGIIDAARAVRVLAGIAPPAAPVLELATRTVHIEDDESVLRVPLRNVGGGTLVVGALTVTTVDGIPWLTATHDGTALRLEVDRDALAPASHLAEVELTSNGGPATLTVVADVAELPADVGPIRVVLRDFASRNVVATTMTTIAESYRYRFDSVSPGIFEIVATTDRNGDGALCDRGELCGAYPRRKAPETIAVGGGAIIRARDFTLDLVVNADDAP